VPTHPPYALAPAEFRFRALAALTGRSALGGARELVLASLLAARLADGMVGESPLPAPLRRARAVSARSWLSALTLPANARAVIARVFEASAGDSRRALREAWEGVVALVGPVLDVASRTAARRLTASMDSDVS
jgi:hypothetical protein